MSKPPAASKTKEPEAFEAAPDGWDRFERATAAVVKSAEKHKANQRPARIVKKSKPQKL